ncbi:MAG: NAD-dependent epimerase/dehydratase family protein [Candidatus Caldarchaeales archaeon]
MIRNLEKAVKRIACERMVHAYAKLYGFRAVALRYTNVVGPRLRHRMVWDFTNRLLRKSTEQVIPGDGKQVWSYIYIDNAIEATIIGRTETSYEVYKPPRTG